MVLGQPTIDTCWLLGEPPRRGAGSRVGIRFNTPGVDGGRAGTLSGGSPCEP